MVSRSSMLTLAAVDRARRGSRARRPTPARAPPPRWPAQPVRARSAAARTRHDVIARSLPNAELESIGARRRSAARATGSGGARGPGQSRPAAVREVEAPGRESQPRERTSESWRGVSMPCAVTADVEPGAPQRDDCGDRPSRRRASAPRAGHEGTVEVFKPEQTGEIAQHPQRSCAAHRSRRRRVGRRACASSCRTGAHRDRRRSSSDGLGDFEDRAGVS